MSRYNLRKRKDIEYFPDKKNKKCKEEKNKEELENKYFSIFPTNYPPLCHCLICYEYMGEMNPRQYCEKTYCPYENFEPLEIMDIRVRNLKNSEYVKDNEELKKEVNKLCRIINVMF